jgi:hypothetical protein
MMRRHDPTFGSDGRLILTELTVVRPGIVRVKGCWTTEEFSIVITEDHLSFCYPNLAQPVSLIGEGEDTVLVYSGPVTTSVFGSPRTG